MKKIGEFISAYWHRSREFIVHNVLHLDDSPHRIALGFAIAMFVTFTPTIGFQMALVFILCAMFGGNKLVGLPLVWISNPFTLVPIYYPCLRLGSFLMGRRPWKLPEFKKLFLDAPEEWLPKVRFFGKAFWDIAIELWVGCIVIGGVLGIFTYYFVYGCVCAYRLRVWGQLTPPPHHGHPPKGDHPTDSAPVSTENSLNSKGIAKKLPIL